MNIWSVATESVPEHNNTATTKYMIAKESLQEQTSGTYLGLAGVFEVRPGATLAAHRHPTHEYWFVLEGSGVMQVGDEAEHIMVGDLIYTTPNTPHMFTADQGATFRAFVFAQSYPGQGSAHVDVELTPVAAPASG
jgi:quercetin dioxygenase-like cupin family protein